MAKADNDFIKLLNSRVAVGKAFCKNWQKDIDKWIKDYEIDSLDDFHHPNLHNKVQVPYIFSTVESGLPSIFEQLPDIMMKQRGKLDRDFTEFAGLVWSYIAERVHLEEKIENVGTFFLIGGMGFAKWGWNLETKTVKGEPEEVEITNEDGTVIGTETQTPDIQVPVVDEPILKLQWHKNIIFSPDSVFAIDDTENQIPWFICINQMDVDEVEYLYNIKAKDDEKDEVDFKSISKETLKKEIHEADKHKMTTYEYYGIIPKKYAPDKDGWRYSQNYQVVFNSKRVLQKAQPIPKKPLNMIGGYGSPTKFFKFGDAKVLRKLEQDVSLGRSRIMDIRDKLGTKIAIPQGTEYNKQELKNPADYAELHFNGQQIPTYVNPPPVPETIMIALQQAREDIQMASAQLDLSRGGSQSVVNTATGQQIFAEATQKRTGRKRRKIAKFIKYITKNLLQLSGYNWDIEKFSKITDLSPEEITQKGYIDKLQRIGNDYDVDIDIQSISMNKETMSAQAIALYREIKDDESINKEEVLKEVLKIGFSIKDLDRFLTQKASPEQVMKALEFLVENQIIPPEMGGQIAGVLGQYVQQKQEAEGLKQNQGGRPATQDPTSVVKNSMPSANQTQITAQTSASGKQANQPR